MKYRNANYINNNGWIDCEIQHPVYGWGPYTLNPADTDMTVNNDDLLAAMAAKGDVAPYVPPTQAELDVMAAAEIREERNRRLLTDVDPIVMNSLRWGDLTPAKQAKIASYRRLLLDVPQQAGFPRTHVWPEKPV